MMFSKLLVTILILFSISAHAAEDQDYLLSFIPATCCVTNECCWTISEKEVIELPDNKVQIKSTGQIVEAKRSPDDKYYRCACDYDHEAKHWNKHQGANTRCLFVPNRGF